MRKIFIDCGLFSGVSVQQYVWNKTWKIYAFDADPDFNEAHFNYLPKLEFINKAVWIEDTTLQFVNHSVRKDAGRLLLPDEVPIAKTVEVEAIDFSAFLKNIPDDAWVVCSMDIEGAEFEVLPKLIKDGTIHKIALLDIEFHHRLFPDPETYLKKTKYLLSKLQSTGMTIRLKVPL